MRDASRDGLVWDSSGLDVEPRWAREPNIAAIERVCRRHLNADDCAVFFHTAGAFNKLYLVDTSSRGRFMMRVSLPVDPHNKTRGEVQTLQLVQRQTDIPVPKVVAFDDTSDNDIGFEWILMQLMPGRPVYYRWRRMTMQQKELLVSRVVDFQAQLYRLGSGSSSSSRSSHRETLRTIGTLHQQSNPLQPGQIVHPIFFSGAHYHYTISRGPFRSSHDWLRAYLTIIIKEHTTALAECRSAEEDEDDREYAEGVLRVARKLLRLLHKIFPAMVHPAEPTVLWHDDLSLMNIMVDDDDRGNVKVTAVIDWECVSTMPLWVASQMPEFLRGAVRETRPDRNCYTDVSDKGSDGGGGEYIGQGLEDSLDNEGKTELYWIHLMEYEQTQLRKVYSARMRRLRPGWDMEVSEGALKVDFLGAVSRCGAGFYIRRIEQWVDAIERKEFLGLMEVLRVGIRKEKPATAGVTGVSGGM
ncbi:phosphotransferase enzyme family-domain-containing protein [Bombardia bombarda]|uniref:Phosphotransferase enzyme family-domain-containing protein n=1 Tax=Bombardia bombarda TaxID=252184 RepID=A0AA40BY19_9PEZI|nr:phosphotransferase enzyme family-domain-containing protein [Bombardia bombarda]